MQTAKTISYGYVREVALEFEEAVIKIEAALKTEGFGILCQIDIQAKLKEKLGQPRSPSVPGHRECGER